MASKLQTLIQELCPDGVEYRELEQIAYYSNTRVDSSLLTPSNYVSVETLLPNKQGRIDASAVPSQTSLAAFKKGDVLIGNIRPYLKKIWLADFDGGTNGDVLVVCLNTDLITPEFLYYCLSSDRFFHYSMQFAKGAKMPRGDKEAIMLYPIPVPPLPVQAEIVRILDAFSALTAELTAALTAELTARKKQYEYYRDSLLTFDRDQIQYVRIGDVCSITVGGDVPKESFSKLLTSQFNVPIISNGIGNNALYGFTNIEKVVEPSVTIAARGTIGYAEYRDYPFFPIIRLLVLSPLDKRLLNTKFLFYSLQGREYDVPKSGIPQLTAPTLKNEFIPLPPLDVQNRIVTILDQFDALCSDLTVGLPAEIAARKKQYEYYRDKLLTFRARNAAE